VGEEVGAMNMINVYNSKGIGVLEKPDRVRRKRKRHLDDG